MLGASQCIRTASLLRYDSSLHLTPFSTKHRAFCGFSCRCIYRALGASLLCYNSSLDLTPFSTKHRAFRGFSCRGIYRALGLRSCATIPPEYLMLEGGVLFCWGEVNWDLLQANPRVGFLFVLPGDMETAAVF